ncbi:tyrosine-type recombinase/integrase [Bacillus chungangensis]|uniref:Integrase n=1 Tax=Bacillus chungangensis TaxID=587633 RepID=A0ABT9WSS1_9BACI|nr:tyrosine-type recombinase/integrase [Bacillus chungangensis]MDQ0175952.1 integrase [Bacillus chungangensis]
MFEKVRKTKDFYISARCINTIVSTCLEAGMSLKEVQDRLGHSSIKTTGDVYTHVTDVMKEKTVDLFEKYISQ